MIEKAYLDKIERIVRQAGEILLSARLNKEDVSAKDGPANFVTVYDKKIQIFLMGKLAELIPDVGFYGEEDTEGNNHNLDGYTFFIDPIDGTTNFLFDYQHSCISVGLADKGCMIAGWVYKPYTNEMWSAVKGKGAYLNGRRLYVSNDGIESGIVAFGCARYNDDRVDLMFDVAKECFLRSLSIRNGGSAALDLCRVASGTNAAYFELLLQPYDYAAASIIIEEAGGWIGQINGEAITLHKPCPVIGGSKMAASQVREMINSRI